MGGTMKGGVVTKLRLVVFLPIILVLWDDKGTLAGSVPQMHDRSQFSKFLVRDKPGGKKSLIEIEGKSGRKESVQKQTAKSQCKDVTFGECSILKEKIWGDILWRENIEECRSSCDRNIPCDFYRYNYQTRNCTMLTSSYKSLCKIRAAPVEKQASTCLRSIQPCDPQT